MGVLATETEYHPNQCNDFYHLAASVMGCHRNPKRCLCCHLSSISSQRCHDSPKELKIWFLPTPSLHYFLHNLSSLNVMRLYSLRKPTQMFIALHHARHLEWQEDAASLEVKSSPSHLEVGTSGSICRLAASFVHQKALTPFDRRARRARCQDHERKYENRKG